MMLLTIGTALPALGTVIVGDTLDNDALRWLGVAVGVLSGVLAYVLLGRTAYRGLARRGPELLFLMQAGKEHRGQPGNNASVIEAMPRSRRRLLNASVVVGCIALFPQTLVPTLMKASGDVAQVWFLPLYMPAPWQWPTIAFMFLLGGAAFTLAWRVYVTEDRARGRRRSTGA